MDDLKKNQKTTTVAVTFLVFFFVCFLLRLFVSVTVNIGFVLDLALEAAAATADTIVSRGVREGASVGDVGLSIVDETWGL